MNNFDETKGGIGFKRRVEDIAAETSHKEMLATLMIDNWQPQPAQLAAAFETTRKLEHCYDRLSRLPLLDAPVETELAKTEYRYTTTDGHWYAAVLRKQLTQTLNQTVSPSDKSSGQFSFEIMVGLCSVHGGAPFKPWHPVLVVHTPYEWSEPRTYSDHVAVTLGCHDWAYRWYEYGAVILSNRFDAIMVRRYDTFHQNVGTADTLNRIISAP